MLIGLLYMVPGIFAAVMYCKMKGIALKSIEFILSALIFAFLINFFVIGVAYLGGHGISPVESLHGNIGTTVKYAVIALVSSVALPNVVLVISKFSRGKKHE